MAPQAPSFQTDPLPTSSSQCGRHRGGGAVGCRRVSDVASGPMATRADSPRLAPGNEAEWARINEEEARQEAEYAASLSMNERVILDQQLSQQAVSVLVSSVKAGHSPRRALWY